MKPSSALRLSLAALALAALGCGGVSENASPPDDADPSFETSPIVFGSYDPPGTFFITLENRTPRYLNDNYYFYLFSLSPSRERMLQMAEDPEGNPDLLLEVFPIKENAPLLLRTTFPGSFIGWESDDTLLFTSPDSDGILRFGLDGSQSLIRFPDFVLRERGAVSGGLAPDRATAAFVVSTPETPLYGPADTVITIDTRTGQLRDRWTVPISPDWPSGLVFWASDGNILMLAREGSYSVASGQASLGEPFTLPFSPCEVRPWTEPGTFLTSEMVIHGDYGTCENTWIVATDGSSAIRREGPSPAAISPDGERILLNDFPGLTVTNPDGSNPEAILELPSAHHVAW